MPDNYSYAQFIASIENFHDGYGQDINEKAFFGFPIQPILEVEGRLINPSERAAAYFSMEFGIAPSIYNSFHLSRPMSAENQFFTHDVFSNYWLCDYLFKVTTDKMLDIPIYGGGLGVLAGDAMKSSADLGYNIAGVGILWNKGYFKQKFWYKHGQVPEQLKWDPHTYPGLIPLKDRISINTKEGVLYLRPWKYYVFSHDKKYACPIILLDSQLAENSAHFQKLTDQLYRSDDVWWKIFQRAILGIGGMKVVKHLGYHLDRFHLNEGHAAFALIEHFISQKGAPTENLFKDFVYTCHTPVAAGHDRFLITDVAKILPDEYVRSAENFGRDDHDQRLINLTLMCLTNCPKVNAVAKKHEEITKLQFPEFAPKIESVTNGVHLHTWLSPSMGKLFDQYNHTFGDWRHNPANLQKIEGLKNDHSFRRDLFGAHQENKRQLINVVKHWQLKDDVLTIGWARRIAGYKRPALIFHHADQILRLAKEVGPLQIILAGKAHPNDDIGSAHIEEILDHIDQLNMHKDIIKVLILENYDTYFGKLLTNSVDVWLNNPLPPFEASGTSGMKAILNGVLQLTTMDGWVVEAKDDDIGWFFGYQHKGPEIGSEKQLRLDEDSQALYNVMEEVIRLYAQTVSGKEVNLNSPWIDKMINCISRGAFFNTHRMMQEYYQRMWYQETKVH